MTCRTCQFLLVEPDRAGRIKPRAKNAYKCIAHVPMPTLPVSVTKHYDFKWPPARSYMSPDDGNDCPLYKSR
jgi:hypothetical protein